MDEIFRMLGSEREADLLVEAERLQRGRNLPRRRQSGLRANRIRLVHRARMRLVALAASWR